MSQIKIRNALEERVLAWAAANSIPVAWENVGGDFEDKHIRVVVFPSPTGNPSLGVEHRRYRGLLRLQAYVPTEIDGPFAVETLAAQLVELFPRGLTIEESGVFINIENTPSQSPVYQDGKFVYVVVETTYRCETY